MQLAIFLQSLVDDLFELWGQFWIQSCRRCGRLAENPMENSCRGVALKWESASHHLIQHHSEGEQVGPSIQFFPACLFRRHVSHRAERRARAGEVLFRGSRYWQL